MVQLIKNIEKLDSLDHIAIIKIIHETMQKKPYFVTNRQTMMDLDNLNNQTLWRIKYHVDLCLENVKREESRQQAEKRHQEALAELEDDLRRQSKLKLTQVVPPEEEDEDEETQPGEEIDDQCSIDDMGAEVESLSE